MLIRIYESTDTEQALLAKVGISCGALPSCEAGVSCGALPSCEVGISCGALPSCELYLILGYQCRRPESNRYGSISPAGF